MTRFKAGLVLLATMAAGPAAAQVAVDDIRAQLFLERSGKLSDNIAGSGKAFRNTPLGEGEAGEPADAILISLGFSGAKNSRSSDKIARDLAQVTVTQNAKSGQRILLKRAYGGFQFGADGKAFKAFLIDNATCSPLEIEVKVGRSRKTTKLDFSCGE